MGKFGVVFNWMVRNRHPLTYRKVFFFLNICQLLVDYQKAQKNATELSLGIYIKSRASSTKSWVSSLQHAL